MTREQYLSDIRPKIVGGNLNLDLLYEQYVTYNKLDYTLAIDQFMEFMTMYLQQGHNVIKSVLDFADAKFGVTKVINKEGQELKVV